MQHTVLGHGHRRVAARLQLPSQARGHFFRKAISCVKSRICCPRDFMLVSSAAGSVVWSTWVPRFLFTQGRNDPGSTPFTLATVVVDRELSSPCETSESVKVVVYVFRTVFTNSFFRSCSQAMRAGTVRESQVDQVSPSAQASQITAGTSLPNGR